MDVDKRLVRKRLYLVENPLNKPIVKEPIVLSDKVLKELVTKFDEIKKQEGEK